ncbi:MAG: glycosyltransferase [Oscillospiraceae bacterium]|nr:glycosyltransferase [Oscillospiraceae bacterium]
MISIIIPIYNGFAGIPPSVLHARTEKEILLVDDGSEDDSADRAAALEKRCPEVRLIRKAHTGVSDTRNAGIRAARGRYIMFLDADDDLRPGSVEAIVKFFDACPEAVDLVTYPIETLYRGYLLAPHFRYKFLTYSGIYDLRDHPYIGQTTMNIAVRNRFEENVLFDTQMTFSEDQMYCCDVLHRTLKMGYCKEAAYIYHRSENTSSGRLSGACYVFEQSMQMFERIFARYPGEVPKAFQGLYINDLAWKLRSNILYPYHYDAADFARAQTRIRTLLRRVETQVIWEHPDIDPYHKCYWLTQKPDAGVTAFCEARGFGLQCAGKTLLEEAQGRIAITRIRRDGDTLIFRGFLKSGVFSFTQAPQLFARLPKRQEVPLFRASQSYYLCHTQTNLFYAFCLEIPCAAFSELSFEMELMGATYPCFCEFQPKAPFSEYYGRYRVSVDGIGMRYEPQARRFVRDPAPALAIRTDNSRSSLMGFGIHTLRNRAAALRERSCIHLYYDCRGVEKDNGYYRFQADFDKRDGVERYYICDPDNPRYGRLFTRAQRKRMVPFGSKRHRLLVLAAKRIFTAFIEDNNLFPFTPEELPMVSDLFDFTVEYLQHGILHARVPWKFTPQAVMADKICISTEYERRLFTERYHFRPEDIYESLMPRFRSLDRTAAPQKRILYAPSWRAYLVGDNIDGKWEMRERAFLTSDYYRGVTAFLHDPALGQWLEAHDYVLDFKLHPIFACYRGDFTSPGERIRIVGQAGPPETYAALVTDFSSYAFDFLYLGRPVFSFIPDPMQFRCGMNTYREIEPESAACMIPVESAAQFCEKFTAGEQSPGKMQFLEPTNLGGKT